METLAIFCVLVALCHAKELAVLDPVIRSPITYYTPDCMTKFGLMAPGQGSYCAAADVEGLFVHLEASRPRFVYGHQTVTVSWVANFDGVSMAVPQTVRYGELPPGSALTSPLSEANSVPCNAPNLRYTGTGVTRFDCCVDASRPSCLYFGTNNTDLSPINELRCVTSYDGYGDPWGTPCQKYYTTESIYGIQSRPTTGDWFTNFGFVPITKSFNCYVENWSNYRTYSYPYDYAAHIDQCDYIYYAFYTYESGSLREWHDEQTLTKLVAAGRKVLLTIGGWNFDQVKATYSWTEGYDAFKTFILSKVQSLGLAGVDIDLEFPGSRGLPNTKVFYENVRDMCDSVVDKGLICASGILTIGNGYVPAYYDYLQSASHVNLFGYDLAGCFDMTKQFFQSRLRPTVDFSWSLQTVVESALYHFDATVLSLGLPLYTRGFARVSGNWTCFPLEADSSMGEAGTDLLVLNGSVALPWFCTKHPGYRIVRDPTDEHIEWCEGDYVHDGLTYAYRIPYPTLAFYAAARELANSYGVTKMFLYALSMSPDLAAAVRSVVMNPAPVRNRRAVGGNPYYAFPSSGTGVVDCAGIVYFSPQFIVTSEVYSGCVQPDGKYCYYLTPGFTCTPSTVVAKPTVTYTSCQGVDVVSLLPSNARSKRVMCPDMSLYVQQTTLCLDVTVSEPKLPSDVVTVSVSSTFRTMYTYTFDQPTLNVSVIRVPKFCSRFATPLSCIEFVCGSDASCITDFRNSPYFAVCDSVVNALNEYTVQTATVSKLHNDTLEVLDTLLYRASTFYLAETGRRKRFAFLLGVLAFIGGALLGGGGGSDNSDQIEDLDKGLQNAQTRIDSVEKQMQKFADDYNSLQKDISTFAQATDKRFAAVDSALTKMDADRAALESKLAVKFQAQTNVINALADSVTDLKLKLSASSKLAATTTAYSSSVSTMLSKLSSYSDRLLELSSVLRVCSLSLAVGSFDGCVNSRGKVSPVSIQRVDTGADVSLVFFYLHRSLTRRLAFQGSRSYCSGSTMYVSASQCIFVLRDDTVYHMTMELQLCESPFITAMDACDHRTISLSVAKSPVGISYTAGASPFNNSDVIQEIKELKATVAAVGDASKGFDNTSATHDTSNYTKAAVEQLSNRTDVLFEFVEKTYYGLSLSSTVSLTWVIIIVFLMCFVGLAAVVFELFRRLKVLQRAIEPPGKKTV